MVVFLLLAIINKNQKIKRVFLYLTFSALIFFTSPLPIYLLANGWNLKTKRLNEINTEYDVAIVLGGFSRIVKKEPNAFYISPSGDRIIKAIQLYRAKKVKKIFISGGSGKVFMQEFKEGKIAAQFLNDVCIDTSDVLYEDKSRNTYENALFTKQYLDSLGLSQSKLLLLTSSYHMRRSMACFNKVGLVCTPFVVDPQHNSSPIDWRNPEEYLLLSVKHLSDWDVYLHELVGYLIYKFTGYIN
jgi:uncharacterized SAM-binding protein YcdF (DUF218 family)